MEIMDIEYVKLRDAQLDEKWLQNAIEDNPGILNLGDVTVIEREKKQSSGGRIDFLLHDPEKDVLYETEIMLGKLDESHIIRSIEYWDLESRRYPDKEHKAIIVAEEITNRFFNVIYLMNRSIPIMAIQLNAIRANGKIGLVFTKVLDVYEKLEIEETLPQETKDRAYWEKIGDRKFLSIADGLIREHLNVCATQKITYNKYHIAIGNGKKNTAWLHLRKRNGNCYFEFIVGEDNVDTVKDLLDNKSITYNAHSGDSISIILNEKNFTENIEVWNRIFGLSESYYA